MSPAFSLWVSQFPLSADRSPGRRRMCGFIRNCGANGMTAPPKGGYLSDFAEENWMVGVE